MNASKFQMDIPIQTKYSNHSLLTRDSKILFKQMEHQSPSLTKTNYPLNHVRLERMCSRDELHDLGMRLHYFSSGGVRGLYANGLALGWPSVCCGQNWCDDNTDVGLLRSVRTRHPSEDVTGVSGTTSS